MTAGQFEITVVAPEDEAAPDQVIQASPLELKPDSARLRLGDARRRRSRS